MENNTLAQLEEFRRRKLAERKGVEKLEQPAADKTSIRKTSAQCPPRDPRLSSSNVADDTVDQSPHSSSMPSQSPPGSVFERALNWLYFSVMPDHVIAKVQPEVIEDDEISDLNTESETEYFTDKNSEQQALTGHFAFLPAWLRQQYVWGLLAWICGFALMVRLGWGAVFFTISVLLFVWASLNNSRKRKRGALSAYSVFNPNCERIEGTLDAEQLQRQMFLRF